MATSRNVIEILINAIDKSGPGLETARKRLDSVGKSMEQVGKKMAVAGGAVTAGFGLMVRSAAAAGDEFQKTSKRTGIAVEDLSRLSYAAELADADLGALRQGVRRVATSMKDAQLGLLEAQRTWEELGVSIKNADGSMRPVLDVILDVSDKMAGMEDATNRVALAQKAFGRSGDLLVPLLREGSVNIRQIMKASDDLGFTWSTTGANAAAEYTDAMTSVKFAVQSVYREVFTALLPALMKGSEGMLEAVVAARKFIEAHQGIVKVVAGAGGVTLVLGTMLLVLGQVAFAVNNLVGAMVLLRGAVAGASLAGFIAKLGTVATLATGIATTLAGIAALGVIAVSIKLAIEEPEGFGWGLLQSMLRGGGIAGGAAGGGVYGRALAKKVPFTLPTVVVTAKAPDGGDTTGGGGGEAGEPIPASVEEPIPASGPGLPVNTGRRARPGEGSERSDLLVTVGDITRETMSEEQAPGLFDFAGVRDNLVALFDDLRSSADEVTGFLVNRFAQVGDVIGGTLASELGQGKLRIKAFGEAFKGVFLDIVGQITAAIAKFLIFKSLFSIFKIGTGGPLSPLQFLGFADGGIVRGGIPGKDSVPALLQPGELVVPKSGVDALLSRMGGAPALASPAPVVFQVGTMIGSEGEFREFARRLSEAQQFNTIGRRF